MGLREVRQKFFNIRESCQIQVKRHAFADYPERGFSEREIVNLVRSGIGRFVDNTSADAIPDSYLFFPKDDLKRECKLVIKLTIIEIEDDPTEGHQVVIVCSAYRSIENEI